MTLAPLLAAPLAVQIHLFTVVPAFFLGTWQIFLSRKGAPFHRALGYVYLALMTVTAIAAIFVHQLKGVPMLFGFGPIHLFIPLTLAGVAGALYGAKTHNIRMHKRSMLGVYVGGLLIAGGFAFMPGRIMHAMIFGG
jgi:uncharacterized membrane protein